MVIKSDSAEVLALSRAYALCMIYSAGSGHPGGSLSAAEIIVALAEIMEWDKDSYLGANRLVLSKGHSCPILYAVAAVFGLLDVEELSSFRKLNSRLQGHPHVCILPWVGSSTGSLGQGVSVALGQAMANKFTNADVSQHVYAVVGDGELQEGQVWEALAVGSHHSCADLTIVLDYNKMQSDDRNENICGLEPLVERIESFNWKVVEVDGHDYSTLRSALIAAKDDGLPTFVIAHTIKGKGVKFMESVPKWHGSVTMTKAELSTSLSDLGFGSESVLKMISVFSKEP